MKSPHCLRFGVYLDLDLNGQNIMLLFFLSWILGGFLQIHQSVQPNSSKDEEGRNVPRRYSSKSRARMCTSLYWLSLPLYLDFQKYADTKMYTRVTVTYHWSSCRCLHDSHRSELIWVKVQLNSTYRVSLRRDHKDAVSVSESSRPALQICSL